MINWGLFQKHPGGEETLKEVKIKTAFSDATEAFEDTGHSMDARDMMKKYEIGQMDASVKAKTNSDPKVRIVYLANTLIMFF